MQKFSSPKEVELLTQTTQRVLCIYENDVYDLTKFLHDHPGGPSIIEDYNGMDISEVFHDEDIHEHSESALKMLFPFKIGEIIDEDDDDIKRKIGEDNSKGYPQIAADSITYKNFEISLNKGLIMQVFYLKKEDYEDFIDHPIHLPNICRLFDNPLLELTTRNKWYNIPLLWGPVFFYLLYNGIFFEYAEPSLLKEYVWRGGSSFSYFHAFFTVLLGLICWTQFEYLMHRFLFHCNWWLPDNKVLLHLHFLLHGIHHALPMDPDRLVFPPILGIMIYFLIYNWTLYFFAGNFARLGIAGFLLGYISYDMTHYYIHHGSPKSGHFSAMKSYHNKHHYKVGYKAYGITSKFWDYVYGTEIPE